MAGLSVARSINKRLVYELLVRYYTDTLDTPVAELMQLYVDESRRSAGLGQVFCPFSTNRVFVRINRNHFPHLFEIKTLDSASIWHQANVFKLKI